MNQSNPSGGTLISAYAKIFGIIVDEPVILVSLMVIVGICAYQAQKKTPPASPPLTNTQSDLSTNHPYLSFQLPSRHGGIGKRRRPQPEHPVKNLPGKKSREYLRLHNRNAASLLTAFHALQDTNYLNELATNFPNDPQVQWTILTHDAFPEDRRKWLDSFKTSSPSNSLANYLSARDYFKNNQPDAATKELLTASAKSQFKAYSMETILEMEDFGRFNQSSPTDIRTTSLAVMSVEIVPQMSDFKGIAGSIRELQQQYATSGDTASVQNLAQAGITMANRLSSGDNGKFLINQLVANASEAVVLDTLEKNTAYDFLGGETPAQRLAEFKQQKASMRDSIQNWNSQFMNATEDQKINYWERTKIYGELEALHWWQQQNPPQAQ